MTGGGIKVTETKDLNSTLHSAVQCQSEASVKIADFDLRLFLVYVGTSACLHVFIVSK